MRYKFQSHPAEPKMSDLVTSVIYPPLPIYLLLSLHCCLSRCLQTCLCDFNGHVVHWRIFGCHSLGWNALTGALRANVWWGNYFGSYFTVTQRWVTWQLVGESCTLFSVWLFWRGSWPFVHVCMWRHHLAYCRSLRCGYRPLSADVTPSTPCCTPKGIGTSQQAVIPLVKIDIFRSPAGLKINYSMKPSGNGPSGCARRRTSPRRLP